MTPGECCDRFVRLLPISSSAYYYEYSMLRHATELILIAEFVISPSLQCNIQTITIVNA